jgi:hypothetical protein
LVSWIYDRCGKQDGGGPAVTWAKRQLPDDTLVQLQWAEGTTHPARPEPTAYCTPYYCPQGTEHADLQTPGAKWHCH